MARNKQKTITFTTILALLITSAALIAMPTQSVKAQLAEQQPVSGPLPQGVTPDTQVDVDARLSFRPNPVGLNQIFLVNLWTTPAPGADRMHPNYKVTITKPDGSKDVIVMNSNPDDGTAWFEYIADQEGEWKLKFEFQGTYFPTGRYYRGYIVTNTSGTLYTQSAYYKPASTPEQKLIVKKDLVVLSWPPSALPTDYWTRPVTVQHREWASILGNYPDPNVNPRYDYAGPYTIAPNTAHVVWKRQQGVAGLIGGYLGSAHVGNQETTGYGYPSVIYAGRAYQTMTVTINGVPTTCAACYDLRTGELYYSRPGSVTPSYITYIPPGLAGIHASVELLSIGSGRLIKIDPYTGAVVRNESTSPLTTGTYYKNGYVLSVQDLGAAAAPNRYRLINWTTIGTATSIKQRIITNTSWPWSSLPASTDYAVGIAVSVSGITIGGAYVGMSVRAASLKTGTEIWNKTINEPIFSGSCIVADNGKVAILTARGHFIALNLNDGSLAWTSDKMDYPWDESGFGAYDIASAYGLIYRCAYSGVYAFNWTNGKIAWKYEAQALAPYEAPYIGTNGTTVYSWNGGMLIADGKLYAYNTEHSPTEPLTRGWRLHCINATTGKLIWRFLGFSTSRKFSGAVADGYLVFDNLYDGYLYCFGKGKSSTSVAASPKTIAKGSEVLIEGSVLDMSPAQPGTPCVSKESMTTWMEYLHMQMPINGLWGNATIIGVPVTLTAIGDDGSYIDIGTVVTDGYSGTFGVEWTPPEEGTYRIVASFAGDDSYGSSSATTWITVGPAPPEPETPEIPTPTDYMPMLTILAVAVVIAIVIGVANLYALRKRK
ncbi:MAG: PQQ-binding-like beta-propeller repeat protein [Candidatus Bathyarchaeales archaeon]